MADRRINNEDTDTFLDIKYVYFHIGQSRVYICKARSLSSLC